MLGLLLPLLLYAVAGLRPTPPLLRWSALSSVSEYYYTGAVAIFIGVLFALALLLLTYPGYEGVIADRIVGRVSGAAALAVTLFPTSPPDGLAAPPWWTPVVRTVHYASGVVLFVTFILFATWLFRKSSIPERAKRPREKRRRDAVSLACGLVIIVAMLWAATSVFTQAPIFAPETIAIVAFAVSWLVKGEAYQPIVNAVQKATSVSTRASRK